MPLRLGRGECLVLPEELRPLAAMRYPGSLLLPSPPREPGLVVVGDRVTEDAVRAGARPLIAVYDCREVRRGRRCPETGSRVRLRAWNPPGTVSWSTLEALAEAVERARGGETVDVLVEGEEVLLVLPLVAMADHGWVVAYGQPGVGVVAVRVGWYSKAMAYSLLARLPVEECRGGP